ncbi:hypothetical protein [Cellulophaga sp. L1A9]|uniref:hypothetical protein n=1 Tax=Cellulophaga sp. L1A9 TaxID=2686362 RepID=UPI00131DDEA7|nr:hypothetical protein [Cellulophaga sp. L1A9]
MTYFKFFLVVLFFSTNLCTAQTENKSIQGTQFQFEITSTDAGTQTEMLIIFKNGEKLLSHILSDFDGDCSSENIELGTYSIKENNIIFYSYWASADRMEKNIYPYGFRKEVYTVNNKGEFHIKTTKLYIESYIDDWTEHQGMKYLNSAPKLGSEIILMNDYISKSEKMYHSHFVLGNEKQKLEQEVRDVLKTKIKENTGYWKEVYGENRKQ